MGKNWRETMVRQTYTFNITIDSKGNIISDKQFSFHKWSLWIFYSHSKPNCLIDWSVKFKRSIVNTGLDNEKQGFADGKERKFNKPPQFGISCFIKKRFGSLELMGNWTQTHRDHKSYWNICQDKAAGYLNKSLLM